MRFEPADWNTYSKKEQTEFRKKSFEDRQKIIKESYLPMILNEIGDLDKYKLLDIIMELQDEIEGR